MKKILSASKKEILWACLMLLFTFTLPLAKPITSKNDRVKDDKVMLYLEVDGVKVKVELDHPIKQITLENGETVVAWSPDDAAKIIDVLQANALDDAVPDVLGSLRVGSNEEQCLTLDLGGCGKFNGNIPGRIRYSPGGHVLWTAGQLRAIRKMLADGHCEVAFPEVFKLHGSHDVTAEFSDGPTPFLEGPLTPACGECKNGNECITDGKMDCCSTGGRVCSKCKVCSGTSFTRF